MCNRSIHAHPLHPLVPLPIANAFKRDRPVRHSANCPPSPFPLRCPFRYQLCIRACRWDQSHGVHGALALTVFALVYISVYNFALRAPVRTPDIPLVPHCNCRVDRQWRLNFDGLTSQPLRYRHSRRRVCGAMESVLSTRPL